MVLAALFPVAIAAQVQIVIPPMAYKSQDRIDVGIMNRSSGEVSYCVQIGFVSYADADHPEATPTPVYVQQRTERGWGTLMIGPDIGSTLNVETLQPEESRTYPFRLNVHGTVRVLLRYWTGTDHWSCNETKGMKTARSREFAIK